MRTFAFFHSYASIKASFMQAYSSNTQMFVQYVQQATHACPPRSADAPLPASGCNVHSILRCAWPSDVPLPLFSQPMLAFCATLCSVAYTFLVWSTLLSGACVFFRTECTFGFIYLLTCSDVLQATSTHGYVCCKLVVHFLLVVAPRRQNQETASALGAIYGAIPSPKAKCRPSA